MSKVSNTIYLITGANRGLGRGFTSSYLARANCTVIAAVRDPSSASSQSLLSLPTGPNSALHLIKLDSSIWSDAAAAIQTVARTYGIDRLDVVLANAGICDKHEKVAALTEASLLRHAAVNAHGPLALFQAALPMLGQGAKFVVLGSPMGSLGDMERWDLPAGGYGPSKAMANWFARKIHMEHSNVVSFSLVPGFVQTEMGNEGAEFFGMGKAFLTIEESIAGCVKIIDESTREETGGTFVGWNGEIFPW